MDHRLPQTLGAFHRAYPAIEIALTEQHNEPLLVGLSTGDLDAALVGLQDQPLPRQIRTRVIASKPLVLAVPRSHPVGRRKTATLGHTAR